MNTDIRLKVGFLDHPKILKLKNHLGADAVLALQRLWMFTAQYHPEGALTGMDVQDISLAAGWPLEDALEFYETLVQLRLLDVCAPHAEGSAPRITVHDWVEHQPWGAEAKARSVAASVAAKARWAAKVKPIKKQRVDAPRIESHMPPHEIAYAPLLSLPLLTNPKDQDPPLPPTGGRAEPNENLTRRKRLDNADLRPLDPDPDPDKKIKTPPYPPRGVRPETDGLTEALEIARPAPRHPDDDDFEKFITAYPAHRRNRMRAEQAWFSMNGKKPALDVILKCLEDDKGCDEWGRSSGRHIPGADKWITDRRWEREPEKEPY